MIFFCVLIYTPLAHMTWSSGGLFANLGDIIGGPFKGLHVLDFAGGTVVHMSAGLAALAGALYLGKKEKRKKQNLLIYLMLFWELDYYGLVGLASMLVLH